MYTAFWLIMEAQLIFCTLMPLSKWVIPWSARKNELSIGLLYWRCNPNGRGHHFTHEDQIVSSLIYHSGWLSSHPSTLGVQCYIWVTRLKCLTGHHVNVLLKDEVFHGIWNQRGPRRPGIRDRSNRPSWHGLAHPIRRWLASNKIEE